MVAKIVSWIMIILGGIMTVMNYEYIKFSSYIKSYEKLEKFLYEDYIEKGNKAIIGLFLIGIGITVIFIVNHSQVPEEVVIIDETVEPENQDNTKPE